MRIFLCVHTYAFKIAFDSYPFSILTSVCRPLNGQPKDEDKEKDNATTSMEKAPKPQGKGDQIIHSDKEYK